MCLSIFPVAGKQGGRTRLAGGGEGDRIATLQAAFIFGSDAWAFDPGFGMLLLWCCGESYLRPGMSWVGRLSEPSADASGEASLPVALWRRRITHVFGKDIRWVF